MKKTKGLSIRTKLLGLSLATLAILGAGSWISLENFSRDYEQGRMDNFANYAESLGKAIAAQFYERYGDVQAFAVNDSIRSLKPQEMQGALDSYIGLYGIYDLILVVDSKGRFVASNQRDVNGVKVNQDALKAHDFSQEPWFKSILAGKTTDDKKVNMAGTFVEDFLADPLVKLGVGETRYGSSFSAPIKNSQGEIIGVVTNRAGERWMKFDIQDLLTSLEQVGLRDTEVYVLNKEGLAIQNEAVEKGHAAGTMQRHLLKEGHALAKKAIQGLQGAGLEYSPNDKHSEVVGYFNIKSPKWITDLGWSVLVATSERDAFEAIRNAKVRFAIAISIATFLALTLSIWFSVVLSKSLNVMTSVLNSNSVEVNDASAKIAEQSVQLSESATEQAAALQQTMSAVDEISAMVEKNAESANRSKEVSAQSKDAAERGKNIVDQMREAIGEIDSTNSDISNQMEHSNQELGEITRLISDIGQKTKVINEIVFQTKLLSFNASVEAARAGEYGKGFSVVAEEVGNLAQMSGNAAKEITSLLEESIKKVESIVAESRTRVERMIRTSREKVEMGTKTVHECHEALEEIIANVVSVDSLVSEIAVASSEQAAGIKEISKAVGQMEQVTQQNSAAAQSSSSSAEQLRAQAEALNGIVQDLMVEVNGRVTDPSEEHAKPATSPSNTVPFRKKTRAETKSAHARTFPTSSKRAVGADVVPSSDDPGFEE
ncbi:MAG: methyl-accepting chemotaxis protein [Bdellovibrionales bacterium]